MLVFIYIESRDPLPFLTISYIIAGIKKKLFQLSKEKDCKVLQPWIKSLVNHLYWTAASSFDQSGEHMLAKWNSVGNHIINIHSGHSQLFFACEHAELAGRDRQKMLLKPGIKHIHFNKGGDLFTVNCVI
jgi:solute carrier family 8 (sodium/calcium exchanger)